MWDFLGRLFTRRALPAPIASIGRNASPAALRHLIELFPDHRTIGVVDEHRTLVGVLEVTHVKSRLQELDDTQLVVVADLI
ncbi:MAG TPA: hypothetical protein VFQ65_20680 [Kofleriaceae bacterium]|nr:hypothetical protein [Kofleriaceae bacterium]